MKWRGFAWWGRHKTNLILFLNIWWKEWTWSEWSHKAEVEPMRCWFVSVCINSNGTVMEQTVLAMDAFTHKLGWREGGLNIWCAVNLVYHQSNRKSVGEILIITPRQQVHTTLPGASVDKCSSCPWDLISSHGSATMSLGSSFHRHPWPPNRSG